MNYAIDSNILARSIENHTMQHTVDSQHPDFKRFQVITAVAPADVVSDKGL